MSGLSLVIVRLKITSNRVCLFDHHAYTKHLIISQDVQVEWNDSIVQSYCGDGGAVENWNPRSN